LETRAQLEHDARWWIGASNGDVKGVITAAVQQKSRSIILEYCISSQAHCEATRTKESLN
jgi:hypothetical protein